MVAMLSVADAGKRYGKAIALDSVTFDLEAGEVMALIGSNGAGKSTLIKSVAGLVRHTGSVSVGGIDVARRPKAARRLMGYLPQHPALHPDLSVRETAVLYADMKGVSHERARAGVEAVGLGEHVEKTVAALSGGMHQRLALAVALLADPPLLVLDEPGTGLDISARLELRHLVQEQRERGTAVLLSTHWLEDVPYIADRVLVLDHGHVKSLGPASSLGGLGAPQSRLYLRLNGHSPEAIPLITRLFPGDPVDHSGDWLVVTTAAARKARVVEAVVEAGMSILDLRVEDVSPGADDSDVTIMVTNKGGIAHDLSVKGGPKTALLNPGDHATLKIGKVEGRVDLLCSVPGHADAGMRAAIAVTPGSATTAAAAHKMTSAEMDKSYLDGVKAYPAKTKGQGNVDLQSVVQNGVKVFDLTADEMDWEVAPGDVRKGMAYNGMIPGPVIRANVGDRVKIVLHNKLEESTAVHFHGLLVPNAMDGVPGITQPLVKPGESFTYEFTVRNSGSNMYHSHMNGATQIPAGLFGAFVVAGSNEPKVDQDQLMILNDGPLGYTINGKGFPATQPIVAKRGERIRVRYMNEGLQIHPMHLHGMTQTVITKDGNPLPQPYLADTVLVAPGERVDVIVEATELGVWAYHCHILTHAETEAGMFGMVTALIVQ